MTLALIIYAVILALIEVLLCFRGENARFEAIFESARGVLIIGGIWTIISHFL